MIVLDTIKVVSNLKRLRLVKDYAICGGIATIYYAETYTTRDLDVLILVETTSGLIILNKIYNYLASLGYTKWIGQRIIVEGFPTEFVTAVSKLELEALKTAKTVKLDGFYSRMVLPEYLVAMFVGVGRAKDYYKTTLLLESGKIDRTKLRGILKRYGLENRYSSQFGKA